MKFTLENAYKYADELSEQTVAEVHKKMCVINKNLEFLCETLIEQYPQDKVCTNFNKDVNSIVRNIDEIILDTDVAIDEFLIRVGNDDYISLEVVTKEVAISNDLDFLECEENFTQEERDKYEVGDGEFSYYTRLADTEYYFKFM